MPNQSPADELKALQQQLGDGQAKGADLAKEIDRLKSLIADRTKIVTDIDQKTKAWDKGTQAAGQQQKELSTYVQTEKQMLEATVPSKADIAKQYAAALADLAAGGKALQAAQDDAAQKQKASSAAQISEAAKQKTYDVASSLAATNASLLQELVTLRATADKEGAAKNFGRMYFWVLVMEGVLGQLELSATADYTAKLNAAAVDLSAAHDAGLTAKAASDAATAAAAQAQKDLDAKRATWRQNVAASIPDGTGAPKPAQPIAPVAP